MNLLKGQGSMGFSDKFLYFLLNSSLLILKIFEDLWTSYALVPEWKESEVWKECM